MVERRPQSFKPIREKNKNGVEKSILDAATGLFAKQGYDGTTTLEIAKKAQISEKTLFKYFPKKQMLYETIVNLAFEPMLERNSFEAQEGTTELRTIMYRYFQERIDRIRENPDLFRIILAEYIKDKRTIKESPRPGMESAITRMLFRSDINYSEDAKITVSRCISGITMIYLLAMLNTPNDHFNDSEEIDLMIKFVFNGIHGFLPFEQI